MSIQMTPKQRRKANALIRKSCCNYDGGNCIALDDGEPCVCVQSISYSLCCTWFRDWVLPGAPALQAEITSPKGVEAMRRMWYAVSGKIQPRQVLFRLCPQGTPPSENSK